MNVTLSHGSTLVVHFQTRFYDHPTTLRREDGRGREILSHVKASTLCTLHEGPCLFDHPEGDNIVQCNLLGKTSSTSLRSEWSHCSLKDLFRIDTGNREALRKALDDDTYSQIDRTLIWEAYNVISPPSPRLRSINGRNHGRSGARASR